MLGLDSAGKSTTLYRMKLGDVVATTPTIGFNVETVQHGAVSLVVWDIGGQDKLRTLWKFYYQNANCVIFVVDSTDTERLPEIKAELTTLVGAPELKGAPVLVWANKQDLRAASSTHDDAAAGAATGQDAHLAMPPATLASALDLATVLRGHRCSAKAGTGLREGLDWVEAEVRKGPGWIN
jgi:small GTP-binding protein